MGHSYAGTILTIIEYPIFCKGGIWDILNTIRDILLQNMGYYEMRAAECGLQNMGHS